MRAMHFQLLGDFQTDTVGRKLAALYVRWFLSYVLGVILLWLIGFEAIYGNPTPFHAVFRPVFELPLALAAILSFMGLLYLVIRSLPPFSAGLTRGRLARGYVIWLVFTLVAVWAAVPREGVGVPMVVPWPALWLGVKWHLPAIGVFVVFFLGWLIAMRRVNWYDAEPSTRFAGWMLVGLIAFAILFALSLAMIRGGVDGVTDAYERQTYEYIGDIGRGLSIRGLFRDYAKMHPYLSMHSKVHPPGPVVLLWLLSYIAGREPLGLSLATVAVGALGVLPLYAWTQDMLGRRVALTTCSVYVLVPSILLFTATSADILFMPITLTTLFLFWRALHRNSALYALGAGLLYAVMSLTSFSLVAIGAFFAFIGLWRMRDPALRMNVVKTAVIMLLAFLAFHLAVRWWSGFDVVEVFRLSKMQFDEDQVNLDKYTPRYPAWMWKFLNPLCWFFFAGIPVSMMFMRALKRADESARTLFWLFLATLFVLNLLYLARGEGERSAMYVLPFVIIPAAYAVDQLARTHRSLAPLVATLLFLALQCWAIESYLYTYW